jgi:hypothetical protein
MVPIIDGESMGGEEVGVYYFLIVDEHFLVGRDPLQ